MDGRVQEPVLDKLKQDHEVANIDMVTEPGPNLILAEGEKEKLITSIKDRVDISVNRHGSNLIAVVGHYDCAGNPKDKEGQIEDIKKAVERVKNWKFDVQVIGLWVDENWEAEEII